MFLLLLLYCITFLKTICLGADLYDFGIDKGDQELPFSKDDYGITLDVPIIYFEESQNELFISSSGAVTFGKSVDMSRITNLDDEKISAVAIFFVPTESGKIFYRATSSDETLLRDLSSKIRKNFPNRESSEFTALHAVVITWNDMVGKDSAESSNQFQMVLVTDGISSYAFLIYNQLDWTGEGGQQAQAGLYFSDGRRETMVNSGTVSIKELVNLSNNQNEGTYIFRISGSSPEDPRGAISEDDYSYNDYEPEYDPDNEENKQQSKMSSSEECPPDPYRDQCPSECQVLTDDRGCSLCVCTQPPELNELEGSNKEVLVPSQDEQNNDAGEEAATDAEPENDNVADNMADIKKEQSVVQEGGSEDVISRDPTLIHDVEDIALSCVAASEKIQPCNSHARCIDYNPGYCCECLSGYYGNGEECLRNGEPQRINGAFEGVVNGEEIGRAELHTYVMVEEGRSYTALSQIPRHLGPSLLLVNVIGGAMGWLFAKVVSPTSYNGFMLTGGLFNRTVNVRIGDRYAVTIKQQFSGRDIYHYFKAHMFISGTLPKISDKSEVSYDDYEEEYRREGPGFLRSYSSQLVTVKENSEEKQMKLSIDQQISYKECSFKEFTRDSVVVIQVTRPHVVYDAEEHIVRYASANIATKKEADTAVPHSANSDTYSMLEGNRGHEQGRQHQGQVEEQQRPPCNNCFQNPCETGRHLCKLPNMICTPFERSYHCECVKGYHAERDSTVELGWKCRDVNECERGEHNCHRKAICMNLEGSFECRCQDGYEGDGTDCQKMGGEDEKPDGRSPEGAKNCREHQDCHQWGECVFGENGEAGYCKCRGWYVGDGVHHCGPPAETEIKQVVIEDSQPGQIEQTCAGYKCHENAYCDVSSGHERCVCQNGYYGNGISCVIHVNHRSDSNVSIDRLCRSHEECVEHSSCMYRNEFGEYRCTCMPPYTSNGVTCVKLTQDSNSSLDYTEDDYCNVVNNCDTNADCIFEVNDVGEVTYRCRCRMGFLGDGHRCTIASLDDILAYNLLGCGQLSSCDSNAECVLDESTGDQYCQCLHGFDGDGYTCKAVEQHPILASEMPSETGDVKTCREASDCHANAHCVVQDNSLDYTCKCLPGYHGDGVTRCTIADDCTPSDTRSCHENAQCMFDEVEGAYLCKCSQGYIGNGRVCTASHSTTCNEQPSLCHQNAECIFDYSEGRFKCTCMDGTIGDGYTDCRKEEESHYCGKCSSHARCIHVHTDNSWRCKCIPGYVGNGHMCIPYTSCLDDRSLCDEHAECVPNEYGHYVCNCHYGYHGNGRICAPDSESREETLFICRGMTIVQRSTNPDLPGKQLIVVPHQIAVGIDFDCQEERIIWSDIAGHSIMSASINGTDEKKFLDSVLKSPEGVAIDWSSRNVYYTDSVKDVIGVASLDGRYHKTLINEGLVNPRALAIDLNERYLYYSDWYRENPVIGRVRLDGTEISAFITTDINLPNGLAMLTERRELCWVDAGLQQLSCINVNGQNRRIVYAPLQYPFGLTAHNEQRFYWTDWSDNKIHSVSIYGKDYKTFATTIGGSGRLYGIISVPLQCKGLATTCAINNGGCEYLCLPGKNDITCACPDNVNRC